MSDTLVFLQLEHRSLLRMLHLVESMCAALEADEPVDGELLVLAVDYFRDFPDTCHHPKEDAVLRRLEVHDPETAQGLRHLLDDHEQLHEFTSRLADAVRRAQLQGTLHTPPVIEVLRGFLERYREHLDHEDHHFFPIIREKLRPEDWELIDFAMFDQPDPLYDPSAESRFRRLRDTIFAIAAEDELQQGEAGA